MPKSKLTPGIIFKIKKNTYTIIRVLDETGGQGGIYLAEDGRKKNWVIKWYWKNDPKQNAKIQNMAMNGIPCQLTSVPLVHFLWPLDYVSNNESFGYIMEYIDTATRYNYEKVVCHANERGKKWDHKMLCDVSIRLLNGFHALHAAGYCYMDISRGNISFDDDGSIVVFDPCNIRVVDPDELDPKKNIAPVIGTPGFIAPEILTRTHNPNTKTDLWQLSIMLFWLWVKQHPLDGKLGVVSNNFCDMNLLCKEPKFIFDDTKKDNYVGGDMEDFGYVNAWWHLTPETMRKKFMFAFTEGCSPKKRIYEVNWIKDIKEVLSKNLCICPSCMKSVSKAASFCMYCNSPFTKATSLKNKVEEGICLLVFENNKRTKTIPLKEGIIFYGKNLSPMLQDIQKFATVISNPIKPTMIGLKNETSLIWNCIKLDGTTFEVKNGISMVLNHKNKFSISTQQGIVGICIFDFDKKIL